MVGWAFCLAGCSGDSRSDGVDAAPSPPNPNQMEQVDSSLMSMVDSAMSSVDAATSRLDSDTVLPGPDPFAVQPDTSEGLTNVSADLRALLEQGQLEGACDRYMADPTDRRLKLLCGKWMFFYEGFDGLGVPTALYELVGRSFPMEFGESFSRLGLVPDPFGEAGRNLGVAPGRPTSGGHDTLAFTCASCHFGQLSDGRYAVGAPNHDYDYGAHILAISIVPGAAMPGFDPNTHDRDAVARVQPAVTRLQGDVGMQLAFALELLPLIGEAGAGALTLEQEQAYASWNPGTMDFLMAPLPLDDEVHTISKIIDLWNLPDSIEQMQSGMQHAQLAWTGGADSLIAFLESFVLIGGATLDAWPHERLEPLRDYILSLRAPANPSPPPATDIRRGREVFSAAGCLNCHGGPRGSGTQLYTYEEIGTDVAMREWGSPNAAGELCCGAGRRTPRGDPNVEITAPDRDLGQEAIPSQWGGRELGAVALYGGAACDQCTAARQPRPRFRLRPQLGRPRGADRISQLTLASLTREGTARPIKCET